MISPFAYVLAMGRELSPIAKFRSWPLEPLFQVDRWGVFARCASLSKVDVAQAIAAIVVGFSGAAVSLIMFVMTRTLNFDLFAASVALLGIHTVARITVESLKPQKCPPTTPTILGP